MDYKSFKKVLNQIVIIGETQKGFFRKPKEFEMQIYYTSVKNRIMIINMQGVKIDHPKLFVDFKVGDDIKLVYNWIEKYGYEIKYQRNRL